MKIHHKKTATAGNKTHTTTKKKIHTNRKTRKQQPQQGHTESSTFSTANDQQGNPYRQKRRNRRNTSQGDPTTTQTDSTTFSTDFTHSSRRKRQHYTSSNQQQQQQQNTDADIFAAFNAAQNARRRRATFFNVSPNQAFAFDKMFNAMSSDAQSRFENLYNATTNSFNAFTTSSSPHAALGAAQLGSHLRMGGVDGEDQTNADQATAKATTEGEHGGKTKQKRKTRNMKRRKLRINWGYDSVSAAGAAGGAFGMLGAFAASAMGALGGLGSLMSLLDLFGMEANTGLVAQSDEQVTNLEETGTDPDT